MIRIDLRYLMPIVVFYIPPMMILTLGWIVDYPKEEIQEAALIVGGLIGLLLSVGTLVAVTTDMEPKWFYIRKKTLDEPLHSHTWNPPTNFGSKEE